MKVLLIGFLGLLVVLVHGVFFSGSLIGSAVAGYGLALGAFAGICLTFQAAKREGLLTAATATAIADVNVLQKMLGSAGVRTKVCNDGERT